MKKIPLFDQEKCVVCGRFFKPDRRVGKRQRCCRATKCRKRRKRARERAWLNKDPDYFCGRYEYVKSWRQTHPTYQKARRCKKAGEIQTQILRVTPIKS